MGGERGSWGQNKRISRKWATVVRSHSLTFAQGSAVVHTLVVVLVAGAEVGVVVVAQRIPGVPAVVGDEQLVAVELVSQGEEAILCVAGLSLPVLPLGGKTHTHILR